MAKETTTPTGKAPAFSLPNQDGKKVSLKDLLGQWTVLYFYPKDDTPGCTTEACEFTTNWDRSRNCRPGGRRQPDSPESHLNSSPSTNCGSSAERSEALGAGQVRGLGREE